jgi:phosphate transport system permease protein
MRTTLGWRQTKNVVMLSVTAACAFAATLPLLFILWHLVKQGAKALNWEFFTAIPLAGADTGGGVANGIVGSLIIVGLASAIGLPIGIGAGLYLAERRTARFATVVRFLSDVLNGLPSIVLGIFAWQVVVAPMKHFSALAAGLALGAMMVPLVTRTTEEMIRLVPISLREAALALGYARWRTSLVIVLRTAMPGIVTGALVAIARAAGETAPLLFTSMNSNWFSTNINDQMAALPVQIFIFASNPSDNWNAQAWGAALVLIFLVLVISVIARFVTRSKFGSGAGD